MLPSIVETALGSGKVALVEIALAELAIGYGKAFFVSHDPMIVKRELERCDGLLPLPFASFLQREVIVENAERAIIFQIAQKIQGFKIVGAGFLRMVGADMKIAEIDQCVCNGVLIAFRPLNVQDLAIAALGCFKVMHQGAGIAEIAK